MSTSQQQYDQERRAYEAYLLAKTDKEREEAINRLVPGSQYYYNLYFLDRFRRLGGKPLDANETKMYQKFQQTYQYHHEFKQIELRYKFHEYDEAADEKKKQALINEIASRYLSQNFEHYKPEDFQRVGGASSEASSDSEDNTFGQQPKKSSVLDYELYFSKKRFFEQYSVNVEQESVAQQILQNLPSGFEQDLDFSKYHAGVVYRQASSGKLLHKLSDLENPSFWEKIKQHFEEEFKRNKHFELSQELCDKLTLAQMDKLATLHPKVREDRVYIGSYFQKQFAEELSAENQEVWSADEKRANLLQLYSFAKSRSMPKSLQASLLIEVLDLGVKVGIYDEALFRDYLKMPLTSGSGNVFKKAAEYKAKANEVEASHWNKYIGNVQQSLGQRTSAPVASSSWDSTQSELIRKYLERFCEEKDGSLQAFKEEFDAAFLKNIEERVAIYSVEAGEGLTRIQNESTGDLLRRYQAVCSEVIVRFLESNPEVFKVDEEVKLSLELKNVQTLYVKIFEFNTETYYKKTLQPFNTGVNLDGLVASTERTYEQFKDRPANKKYVESFNFPELTDKVGLFIVEFIGNGLSARAVIKKGSLSLIHKPTVAGHLAYVLDENRKVCTDGHTGVYFDGQFFPARQDKGGKIFIPYNKSGNMQSKAILLHNGFAQLCDFERQTENYSFSAWIHLNEESILIGNKAQILIKPQLLINGRLASLELVKNCRVVLTTNNYIDSLPVSKIFENIKFQDGRECILDFQVPPYLQNISVTLDCEVQNITQQNTQKFNVRKDFQVSTQSSTMNICELFLKKEGDAGYCVYVLGKNGEPRPEVNLKLRIMHKWFTSYGNGKEVTLTTDKEGRIRLGDLKHVIGISVDSSYLGISQQWFLGKHQPASDSLLTYPSQVDVVEGETLEFPLAGLPKKSRKALQLIKLCSPNQGQQHSKVVLEDLYETRIQVVQPVTEDSKEEDRRDYSIIRLNKLQEGHYRLKLKKLGKTISITVHRGQYWDSDSFILKRHCLFENRAPLRMVKIPAITVVPPPAGQTKHNITIRLADASSATRVHIFATHFLPAAAQLPFMALAKKAIEGGSSTKTIFPFAVWKNIWMNNRELGDEFRYVFDRKYAERQLGNTLDRPKLLLKREFLQTTQVAQEELSTGTAYSQSQVQQEVQRQAIQLNRIQQQPIQQQMVQPRGYSVMNNCMPMSQTIQQNCYDDDMMNECDYIGGYGGGKEEKEFGYDGLIQLMGNDYSGSERFKILEFQNFLKTPSLTLFNMKPQGEKCEVNFQANLSTYTTLFVIAVDTNSVAQRQVDLTTIKDQNVAIPKRDLSLAKSLASEDKGFTESRTTVELAKDETHSVEDITSTEIQLIDDMKKVKGVLEELMRTNYTLNQAGVFRELNDLLGKWPDMTKEEDKCKAYYKNLCHELNFFIKNKDPEFFEKIVRPFLRCKMEKTFVDHYLLGNFKQLVDTYNKLEMLRNLNAFELCLLVDSLVQVGNLTDAKRLVEKLRISRDAEEGQDIEGQNKIFDIVLNLNMLKVGSAPTENTYTPSLHLASVNATGFGNSASASNMPPQFMPSMAMNNNNNYNPFNDLAGMQQIAFATGALTTTSTSSLAPRAPPGGGNLFGGPGERLNSIPRSHMQRLAQNIQPMAYQSNAESLDMFMPPSESPYQYQQQMIQPQMYGGFGGSLNINADIMQEYNAAKKKVRMAFEEIQSTGEYMETHYYKQHSYGASSGLINCNSFWLDYAEYLLQRNHIGGKKYFLSANFTRNATNQTAAILTFALLDLPLGEAASHGYKQLEGRGLEIQACGNIILFKKEVKEAPLAITNDILVTHRYVDTNASGGEQSSSMPEEFLLNRAYQCEVIMTNVSPQAKSFSLLYQIPQGALPLQMTKYMKSQQQSLSPYTTNKLIFYFYFPRDGDFTHFPSNVAFDQKIIARAQVSDSLHQQGGHLRLKVVKKLSVAKKETFNDVMQSANRNEDVLEFLRTKNLLKGEKGFSFYSMLWMLRDKVFFKKVIEVLRERLIYDDAVWSYSIFHKEDEQTIREYLSNNRPYNILQSVGTSFQSKLFSVTLEESELKHLDYFPMVNARTHMVGDVENWTLNKNFRKTYMDFLKAMVQHSSAQKQQAPLADPVHRMILVQYLQLQDRVTEAIALFKTIAEDSLPKDGTLRMQHDYLSAYFDFFTGQAEGFKTARAIVRKYEEYPIAAWRLPFLEILDQLNEYDGEVEEDAAENGSEGDLETMTEEQKKQKYKKSIKQEPSLTCEVPEADPTLLQIEAVNIKGSVSVKFYIIDAEILFSRTPFLKTNTEEFSYVKPCHKIDTELKEPAEGVTENKQKLEIRIPEHLKLQNMVIEITGEGKQLFRTHYATQIKVALVEAFGELKVTDKQTGKPLPKVYVKVFASRKSGGAPFFFKDGYTDIRGKFDYAQTSGNRLKEVQRFAIFVMSDTLGSIIKECDPPKNQATASSAADSGLSYQVQGKEERLISRINKCNLKSKVAHK